VGGVVALAICTLAFFAGMRAGATDSKDKIFPGAEKHQIALKEALQLVQNFRQHPQAPKNQGGAFERGAVDKILAQPGCERLKFYWAQERDGGFTVVLVGVDKSGKDMIAGAIMERIWPCPPDCGVDSPFADGALAMQK
jgi:hypothetical protein